MTKPHYRITADGSVYRMADGYRNMVANLGTDRDKAAWGQYATRVLTYADLLNAYRSAWLPRKIVDIPALDAVRKWRAWQAEADQITAIEAEEKRLNLREKVRQCYTAARLFGGAAIYIGTGDQNVAEPLTPDRVGLQGIQFLTVLTPLQINPLALDRDATSQTYGKPRAYQIVTENGGALEIHPSRLVVFDGAMIPDPWMVGTGWSDSVLQATIEAIQQADSTTANIASLVFEAKVDVIHIPKLMDLIRGADGESAVVQRLMLGARAKGNNGTLILDGGDKDGNGKEEYDQKQASFGTLPDLMMSFFQAVAGAADIPMTRLFGQSASGLNSTGDGDERNYFDHIQALQELELSPAMSVLDDCLIRSAIGSRPDEVFYTWRPLRQISETERATIFKTTADAARSLAGSSAGELLPIEALSVALTNELTEQGVLPGLDQAIKEYGTLAENEPDEAETAAATLPPVKEPEPEE